MRRGMVSVGIVMVGAGIAHSVRAQQQSSEPRDQQPPAVVAPAPVSTPRFNVTYNHKQWIDTSTFSDLNMGLRLTAPGPVKRLWLAPFVNYSRSLDSAVLQSKTYGGLSIAVR